MARCRSLSEPYDARLSRLLIAHIAAGMLFMLVPGTFLGVVNLLTISAHQASGSVGPAWIQAHGHAQLFGWLGTFILGVGFYAVPRLRLGSHWYRTGWTVYAIWIAGVTLRWTIGVSGWQWRVLLPLAAALELIASAVFFAVTFLTPARERNDGWRVSLLMIEAAAAGMIVTLAVNLAESLRLALTADSLVFPAAFDQRFLALATWGFVVPFIWGFSTRWIPPLLGLPKSVRWLLLPSIAVLFAGAVLDSAVVVAIACAMFAAALRIFEPSERAPKLRGVHPSVGFFLRSAFVWMIAAAILGMAAEEFGGGLVGASRHALTVGFMVVTVFCIGARVLPAFFGFRRLFSTRAMFASLVLISIGCAIRVASQVLAYGHPDNAAWHWLPVSAILEIVAVCLFAANIALSLTTGTPKDTVLEAQRAAGVLAQ